MCISGKFYTFSDILDYARCTENFSIFCYWAFIIFISKTFSHENGDHKIEYSISTWYWAWKLLSFMREFEAIAIWFHTLFLKMDHGMERTNNHIFIFIFQPKTIPCTIQGQDGIMSCQVWHRYAINKIFFFCRYTC